MILSKHDKTQMNNRRKIITQIKDLYSGAKIFHSNHQYLIDGMNKICSQPGYKNLSVFTKGELYGIQSTLFDSLFQCFDFRYQIDGNWIKSHDLTPEQMRSIKNDTPSSFFWKDTDRPFSLPDVK